MDTLNTLDHLTVVVCGTSLISGLRLYRAECSCGWASDWSDDQADADDARTDHDEISWETGR